MASFFPKSSIMTLAALVTVAALALSACTSSPTATPAQPTSTPAPEATQPGAPTQPPVVDAAPVMLDLPLDFPIETYQGEEYAAGTNLNFSNFFVDGKPVILNFWAGLCPPCRAEMPDFQEFHAEHKDEVTLVGVDIGQYLFLGDRQDAGTLLSELGITYPTGFTSEGDVVRKYEVLGMPTTVFLNPDGTVFRNWNGILTKEQLNDRAEDLLANQ